MDICRLCAKANSELMSLFAVRDRITVAERVCFVTSIVIDEADCLPQQACMDCIELTIDAYNYVNRVRYANDLLNKSVSKEETRISNFDQLNNVLTASISSDETVSKDDSENENTQEYVYSEAEETPVPEAATLEDSKPQPESTSGKLISLLVESIHDKGSEKWLKIKLDPDGAQVLEHSENEDSTDVEEASFEPQHIDLTTALNINDNQIIRCCIRKCQLKCRTRAELLRHGAEVHASNRTVNDPNRLFECVVCYRRFETRTNLVHHLKKMIRDYCCYICNSYFDTPKDRNNHIKNSHQNITRVVPTYRLEEQPIKICCGCEATFKTVEELFQHGVDVHQHQYSYANDGREIQCNICYQYFKSNITLRNHQILVYKPKVFFCPECDKAFECPSKLANHTTTHRIERNYACEVCNNCFKTPADLRGHKRIHQEKALICNVCGSRFHKKSQLKSHLKTHDDQAYEFACSICSKQFKEKSNWKNHLKVHTKETPFQCQYCDKRFRYGSDRKRHEISHTGNYPHKCSTCGKAFIRANQLKVHERVCSMAADNS
ncbi:gastrula zinc finger protein XlCGF48.2-like [Wyeomyia smithii]|uniref:gastrula zinc finger protein XlCGF48.2-like n=1 Tax=Wyeomyia smithii TaxID=174621 RepID=UPI002467E0D8|nr:gastrula zinc finger protein XlCGF48.2-like [Wyeomyia smithii]